jgi:nucleotide-binding universal stress UspA family protein
MTTYRVVVGVDGSEGSLRALEWAVRQVRERGGSVQAVMAYEWPGSEAALLAGHGDDAQRQHVTDTLNHAVEEVRREYKDVPVAAEILQGSAPHKLAEASKDADLLVVGSHGHSRLHHAVMGSVSEGCVRYAHCPIVVVPAPHSVPATGAEMLPSARTS